jgi:hypothetical protein
VNWLSDLVRSADFSNNGIGVETAIDGRPRWRSTGAIPADERDGFDVSAFTAWRGGRPDRER